MNLCYRFIFHIFICFVLLFTLLPSANAKDVTLQLKWKHQFQFAGFYAAQKEGYYAEEGLTVTINPADGSRTATDVVLSGQAEFGISDSSLALSRLKGQPVVVVATIFQHSPLGLITLKSSEILSPLELKGKSVMYQKNIDDAVITAMLAESGLADSGFKHIKHNFDDLALLGDTAVDAMSAYLTDQPFLYREKGIDINIISPSNYGIDFYGDLLFVKESYLKSNPAEVEAFRRASLKGWKYALEHQEEMVDWILTNLAPEKSREHLLFEAQETAKMIRPDLIELGHFSVSRMLRIADTYKALGWADENSSLDGISYAQHLNTSSQGMFVAKILGLIIVIMSSLILAFWLINKKLKAEVHKQTESLRSQSNYLQKIKDRLDYAQSIARLGNWEWSCKDDNWWWSNELKILLGLPTQTAPSLQLYLNFVHPDDRETVESSLKEALTTQQDYHLQYRIITAPGDVIDVEEKVEVILNSSGKTESFFGIVLDVTERKKEAERISESEKLYRQMFDNNTAIKLLIDAESGSILRANDAACSFYGYSHDKFLEMKVFEINAHTPDEIQDEMTLALEEDRRFHRFKHKLANGEIRDVEVHSGPVEIDSKKRLFSIIVDVTARNRYESELITKTAELDKEKLKLRESEQMYKTLFEGVSIGIVMQNSMGEITALNETASTILQASREELLNKSSFDPSWEAINENGISVSGENHPSIIALRTGMAQQNRILGLKYPDRTLWLSINAQPLFKENEDFPYAVISSFTDITLRITYEKALKDSQARVHLAQRISGLGVWEWDIRTNDVFWSDEMLDMWGFERDTFDGSFEVVKLSVHPSDFQMWADDVQKTVQTGEPHELKFRIIKPNNEIRWIYALGECSRDEQDNPVRLTGVCKDITAEYEQEAQLKRAASVFSHAQEGIIITDTAGNIIETNQAFHDITGFTQEEVIGENPRILKSGMHDEAFYKDMWSHLLQEGRWHGEVWNKGKNGDFFAENLTISAVANEQGEHAYYVGVFSDITEQKEKENSLQYEAYHDVLTGLPNRAYLHKTISKRLARRTSDNFSILFIDLDGFKAVNDSYGHEIGDELLIRLSRKMTNLLREKDIVSRIGGDEFVILVDQLATQQELNGLTKRLLDAASAPLTINQHQISVSASIGCIVITEKPDLSIDNLIKKADKAMYKAKQQGKNCCVIELLSDPE